MQLTKCTKLQHIALLDETGESEKLIHAFAKLKHLRHLQLTNCSDYEGNAIAAVAANNPELSYVAIKSIHCTALAALALHCPKLLQLHITWVLGKPATALIAAFELLVSNCRQLTHISCDWAHNDATTGYAIATAIGTHCPQLLQLRGFGFSIAGLRGIVSGCRNITHLEISSKEAVGGVTLGAIATQCTRLTHLDIAKCTDVSAAGVQRVVEGCVKLQSFICNNCEFVTDSIVSGLVNNCSATLTELNLQGCDEIIDVSLQAIARHSGDRLVTLNIVNCDKCTHLGLLLVLQKCHCLRSLSVSNGANIISTIGSNGQQLEQLFIRCVEFAITDADIKLLADGCPRLRSLTLTRCPNVTEEAILYVLQRCNRLRNVKMTSLLSGTSAQREYIIARFVDKVDCNLLG